MMKLPGWTRTSFMLSELVSASTFAFVPEACVLTGGTAKEGGVKHAAMRNARQNTKMGRRIFSCRRFFPEGFYWRDSRVRSRPRFEVMAVKHAADNLLKGAADSLTIDTTRP
jgi:hypothetical protein